MSLHILGGLTLKDKCDCVTVTGRFQIFFTLTD